jgi:hypothetical protein
MVKALRIQQADAIKAIRDLVFWLSSTHFVQSNPTIDSRSPKNPATNEKTAQNALMTTKRPSPELP